MKVGTRREWHPRTSSKEGKWSVAGPHVQLFRSSNAQATLPVDITDRDIYMRLFVEFFPNSYKDTMWTVALCPMVQ